MNEVYVPLGERSALRSIDVCALRVVIGDCLENRRSNASLKNFRLESCGLYVSRQALAFESALSEYGAAKAAKKVADTERRARLAGDALVASVEQMQHRIETQEREAERFFVDDVIVPPFQFTERLSVRISYRWRPSPDAEWAHGAITFAHVHDPPRNFYALPPKRKPSVAQQERDRQGGLWDQWDHLRRLGLHSLLEYFRNGGSAEKVPKTFQARVDVYSRDLNNRSCEFWRESDSTKR
jgi:hypothetical protein